jgi:Flp pilus assembly pilin Flp
MANLDARSTGWQVIRRFVHDLRATSAIEFALIVPALVIITLMISDTSNIAVGASHMEGAVRSSVQYAMNGGTNMSQAKAVGLLAWQGKPDGASLNVTSVCKCGSAGGNCNQVCPDGSLPQTFVSAVATAQLGGTFVHLQKTLTETVRVY